MVFLRELGIAGHVRSPTFTLVEPYEVQGCTILHCDFFRLETAQEVADLDLPSYRADGTKLITLVEWPLIAASVLPEPQAKIHLSIDEARLDSVRYVEVVGMK